MANVSVLNWFIIGCTSINLPAKINYYCWANCNLKLCTNEQYYNFYWVPKQKNSFNWVVWNYYPFCFIWHPMRLKNALKQKSNINDLFTILFHVLNITIPSIKQWEICYVVYSTTHELKQLLKHKSIVFPQ